MTIVALNLRLVEVFTRSILKRTSCSEKEARDIANNAVQAVQRDLEKIIKKKIKRRRREYRRAA